MAVLVDEFKKRDVKLLGLSCDKLESHVDWINVMDLPTYLSNMYTVVGILFFNDSLSVTFRISNRIVWTLRVNFHIPSSVTALESWLYN